MGKIIKVGKKFQYINPTSKGDKKVEGLKKTRAAAKAVKGRMKK